MKQQCHKDEDPDQTHPLPISLAEVPSGQVLGHSSWYSWEWTLCALNTWNCTQGHTSVQCKQAPWLQEASALPLQTYPITFLGWTTNGVRQKCLLPHVQMGFVGYLSSGHLQVRVWEYESVGVWKWTWDALLPEDPCSRPCGSPCCGDRVLTGSLSPLPLQ